MAVKVGLTVPMACLRGALLLPHRVGFSRMGARPKWPVVATFLLLEEGLAGRDSPELAGWLAVLVHSSFPVHFYLEVRLAYARDEGAPPLAVLVLVRLAEVSKLLLIRFLRGLALIPFLFPPSFFPHCLGRSPDALLGWHWLRPGR